MTESKLTRLSAAIDDAHAGKPALLHLLALSGDLFEFLEDYRELHEDLLAARKEVVRLEEEVEELEGDIEELEYDECVGCTTKDETIDELREEVEDLRDEVARLERPIN